MKPFMIMLRNEDVDFSTFSPEDYQQLVREFEAWNAALARDGHLIGSAKLADGEGKTLRRHAGRTVVDGPYCETKEAVAGFFLIRARDEAEAVRLAEGCPFLTIGGSVEVRSAPDVDLQPLPASEGATEGAG